MQKIIDAHLHCSELPGDELFRYAKFNGLEYTLDELLRLMEENNVERGLLLSPPLKGNKIVPNMRILELCKKSGDKLSPILTAEPSRGEILDVLNLAKDNEGYVRGFKIRLGYVEVYADDRVFEPLYQYAESKNLPVMFHTGDTAISDGSLIHAHPLTIDQLANKRQDLKIVICHFGNPWMLDVGELLYKHANVYADISGLVAGNDGKYSENYIDSMAAKISDAVYFAGGADKVIFGTDYPIENYSSGLALVNRLKIEADDIEKILFKNAQGVFFSGN